MMVNESTELKFSNWCKNNNYFRLKLQVNIDMQNIGFMKARSMPADFLVLSNTKTYFVEVKEVLKSDFFPNSRFRQQFKLTKLSKFFPNSHIKCYILINFIKLNKVVLIDVNQYNNFLKLKNSKSLKISEIPESNIFSWKDLKL